MIDKALPSREPKTVRAQAVRLPSESLPSLSIQLPIQSVTACHEAPPSRDWLRRVADGRTDGRTDGRRAESPSGQAESPADALILLRQDRMTQGPDRLTIDLITRVSPGNFLLRFYSIEWLL